MNDVYRYRQNLLVVLIIHLLLVASTSFVLSANAEETVTLECSADAFVQNMGTTSGSVPSLYVGYLYPVRWMTFVTFNLSEIPPGVIVDSVEFEIFVDSFAIDYGAWISFYTTSSEWSEAEINWSNKPDTEAFLGSEEIQVIKQWYSWEAPLC